MDFRWIDDLITETGGIGCAPSRQEILAMKVSINLLAEKNNHDVMHFWGKVKGKDRNYLIIIGYTGGLLGKRTAYASLDGVSWFGLPIVTKQLLFHCSHIRTPITSSTVRHPRKTEAFKDLQPLLPPKPPKEEEEEEEEQQEEKPKEEEEEEEEEELPEYEEFSITEDQRVSCLVHIIDKSGLIFPQDALLWKSPTEVMFNQLFNGVSPDATLEDFCRLDKTVRGEAARPGGIIDTMPQLTEDLPARGWKVSRATNSPTTKIISLLWPGLIFISKGKHWGTCYIGDGKRNTDFLFATQ